MRAVTEFASFTLTKAIAAKATLTAEGKTAEEIQASLGTSFKLEGEKLTCFVQALEIAAQNPTNLKRVMVVKLNEGEAAPAKATEVEGFHYIAEQIVTAAPKKEVSKDSKFGGRGGKKQGGPKSSPWGMSPEEKAAKNKKAAPAAKA